MLSLTLDKTTELQLTQLAQRKGKPIDQLLKDILLEYLEDLHDAALGDAVMKDILSGKEAVYSCSEAKVILNDFLVPKLQLGNAY